MITTPTRNWEYREYREYHRRAQTGIPLFLAERAERRRACVQHTKRPASGKHRRTRSDPVQNYDGKQGQRCAVSGDGERELIALMRGEGRLRIMLSIVRNNGAGGR